MVIPRQVKDIDTMEFCSLLGITKDDYINKITEARKFSSYKRDQVTGITKPILWCKKFSAAFGRISAKQHQVLNMDLLQILHILSDLFPTGSDTGIMSHRIEANLILQVINK